MRWMPRVDGLSEYGSSIHAVREPSVPSAYALTSPVRTHASPEAARSPRCSSARTTSMVSGSQP